MPAPQRPLYDPQRDGQRAVLAAILLIFVIAASLSDGGLFTAPTSKIAGQRAPAATLSDDDIRTGSILIAPTDGTMCEHRLIDNDTGRITRNGSIACEEALSWNLHQNGRGTQARIEAIRDGFFQKK